MILIIKKINNNIDKFNEDDQIEKHLLELRKRLDFHSAAILDKKWNRCGQ